jgi:hypothetical protein
MSGSLRLWNAQCGDQLTDAAFAPTQQIQYPQPRRIGDGAKGEIDLAGGLGFHIRLNEYIKSAQNSQST